MFTEKLNKIRAKFFLKTFNMNEKSDIVSTSEIDS